MACRKPILDASRMTERITLQERTGGVDVLGQAQESWSTVAEVWAQAQPLRGREYFSAGQMQAAVDVRFRIRFRDDVLPTWRVLWRSQPHDVVSVIDVEGARECSELMCLAGVRDGR
jgi:SPP1 family predicted phage head-tail adaptor